LSRHDGPAAGTDRWRVFRRIRPSYLILLAAVPFVIWLFWGSPDYRAAVEFILPGIGTTVIVTVFAYVIAAILGLGIAGLLLMKQGKRTLAAFIITALLFSAGGLFFLVQPNDHYVLAGQPEGLVAIIRGTPQGLSRQIQAGTYGGGAEAARSVRAVVSAEDALTRLADGVVTAAFLPADLAPPELPVLWEASFLPAAQQNPALGLLVLAVITALLTFAGWQSGSHPLAIFAELYVDMIRGIPMLVIILYIGFPIQGALRDLTGGVIEPDRLTRGIIAISLGYAAYMAEIFRAGIQAVPAGQVEAARSLGLNGWQTALHVIMPQALKIVIPPLGNEFIAMLKDTSLLSLLSLREVTQRTREFTSRTFEYFPGYNTVAILYIGLTLAAASALKFIERRTGRGEQPT
jgi:polar amino acid transport system permease protein